MKAKSYFFLAFIFWANWSFSQISGIVFRDFNANGVRDVSATYNDVGQGGVTIKAYSTANTEVGSTTSAADGTYSFTGLTLPLRIEFLTTLIDDFSGASGSGNQSSVQFFSASTTSANYGINYPANYCQNNPDLVTSCYVNGRPPIEPTSKVMVKYPYSATGDTHASNTYLADAEQIGSTWGIAYNRQNQVVYTSAFLKRHVSMVDNNSDGKEDIGAIYEMTSAGSPSLWLDLATLGLDVGLSLMPTIATRNLPISSYDPSYDADVFDLVGKIGLGDLDISDDNKQLFVVNLFDKKIYTIDIATKTLVGTGITIPSECNGGIARPFGLDFHRGKLYAGATCDATISNVAADLEANLYRLDGVTFTNILSFPLTYTKGYTDKDVFPGTNLYGTLWQPWRNDFYPVPPASTTDVYIYPQPIFVDIEFDNNEELIMSFNDRTGHQLGFRNYGTNPADPITQYSGFSSGDVLRATLVSGSYVLESNANAGSLATAGAGNGQGPGGGEFYFEDLHGDSFGDYHQETVMGGEALYHGSGQIAINVMNPINSYSGGTSKMNNITGEVDADYEVYAGPTGLGKAAGLGDLELTCNEAPIEIGNRVWTDTDSDGIQDAGEAPISGVTVELVKSGTVIATATTDGSGNYYFSNATGTNTTSTIYGITQLMPNMAYTVRIPNVQGGSKQAALGTNSLTSANVGGAGQPDVRDSDGTLVGNHAEVSVLTSNIPIAGANNHTFDFGFAPAPAAVCAICPSSMTISGLGFGSGSAPMAENVTTNGVTPIAESNIAGFKSTGSTEGIFYTFCTEITQPVLPLQNPYIRINNGSTNGLTALQALRIAQVFQASGFNAAVGFGAGNNTTTNMVAMQMAVWNAMYDTDYSISSGSYQMLTNNNVGVRAVADGWLAAAQLITAPNTEVQRLHHASGQDLVFQNCLSTEPGICNAATNTYSITGNVFFANAPTSGTLTVSVGVITEVFTAPFVSPQAYTLSGLTADGASHTVTAVFSADMACIANATYTAPASCTSTCTATQTHTTPVCNSNGTAGTTSDDWFSFSVTGTLTDGSGNYIIKIGAFTSAAVPSGNSVTITGNGLAGNPTLAANGAATYVVRVEDSADSACFTEFTVGPIAACSNCSTPNCGTVTVQKN